ncbi:Beta-glucosidase, partial [Thalictrum thalictroides]
MQAEGAAAEDGRTPCTWVPWLNQDSMAPWEMKDFTTYADVCFREFGDRVTYWTTINEPNVFALGFDDETASYAYTVVHNCLLAHASAARLYKRKYQVEQRGFIGLNIYSYWYVPLSNATEDVLATKRAFDFSVGWIMDPLTLGDYPENMKKNAGSRLPSFTPYESFQVMNSYDFIGLNHYCTMYVEDNPDSLKVHPRNIYKDMAAKLYYKEDGVPAGEYPIDPGSMQGMLEYFKQNYGNPPIYVHENGQRTPSNTSLNDISRVKYLHGYIGSLLEAM